MVADKAWYCGQLIQDRNPVLSVRVRVGQDREEAIDLHEKINSAIRSNEPAALKRATAELRELLFFVEGR